MIYTVDIDARHGHKTSARRFDGYKGHIAVDPDTEIITNTAVGAANAGDAAVAADLIADLVGAEASSGTETPSGTEDADHHDHHDDGDGDPSGGDDGEDTGRPKVYGDAAYGTGEFLDTLADADIESGCKTQPPVAAGGLFAKDRFDVDLDADTVTCPNSVTVTIRRDRHGDGIASFGDACIGCALRPNAPPPNGDAVFVSAATHTASPPAAPFRWPQRWR